MGHSKVRKERYIDAASFAASGKCRTGGLGVREGYFASVTELAAADLNTLHGRFRVSMFEDGEQRALALVRKPVTKAAGQPIIRIQSACLFGETLASTDCDCRWQIHHSLDRIEANGCGAFIYLFQEGRGVGLLEKIKAYAVQQEFECDTREAFERLGLAASDFRSYDIAAGVLHAIGFACVRLLTGNSEKAEALRSCGIATEAESMLSKPHDFDQLLRSIGDNNPRNLLDYLKTKESVFHHDIDANLLAAVTRRSRAYGKGTRKKKPAR
jgi:GTP cyclohydrolase II